MKIDELISKARELAKKKVHNRECTSGEVGCALITDKGNIYCGSSINCSCGIGFCAEHSAIAQMVSNQEDKIKRLVAVDSNGYILPPCGRCRELILQVTLANIITEIFLNKKKSVKLSTLMPHRWQDAQR